MNPKEKAKELVGKFKFDYTEPYTPGETAKQCAFIAVDEIWNALKPHDDLKEVNAFYWQQVKEEIEKL